jgi:uncharacterized ferritin-like protein (DUF455 family)
MNLFDEAAVCLASTDVTEKLARTMALIETQQDYDLGEHPTKVARGIPKRPKLVPQSALRSRKLTTPEGHAALIHAIAHIEFSAINLALDAIVRFGGMPRAYYQDWLQVAKEECEHFSLLHTRLQQLGFEYGDFPAHDGLWVAAEETADDVLVRMAIVPRILEARGLDVTPGIVSKLKAIGDQETVEILRVIFRDEITHVAFGTRWFHYECAQRGENPAETFLRLVEEFQGNVSAPTEIEARRQAGFLEEEITGLVELVKQPKGKQTK